MKNSIKTMLVAAILAITPCMPMHADFGVDSFVLNTAAYILWTSATIGTAHYLFVKTEPQKTTSSIDTQSIIPSDAAGVSSEIAAE